MPAHKKDESRADWMKRCVPYVIKKEGLTRKQAAGRCGGMYDSWKKKQKSNISEGDKLTEMEYEEGVNYEFSFNTHSINGDGNPTDAGFDFSKFIEAATSEKGYEMVIVIGNRFMKGVYVAKEELKKAYKQFNNTMHDLNHMGSGYRLGFFSVVPPDISYIVGWQDNLSYSDNTGEVIANLHIKDNAPRYNEWKNYIEISAEIDRVPNVSMVVFGEIEFKLAKDLPKNSHYGKNGYKADDMVPCMTKIIPYMVATVTRGTCDDKKGCGIKHDNSCNDGTCKVPQVKKVDSNEVDESIERRKYLKERLTHIK